MPVCNHQHSSSEPARFEYTLNPPANAPYQATPTLGSTSTPVNDWRNSTSTAGLASSHFTSADRAVSPQNIELHHRPSRSESSPSKPPQTQPARQASGLLADPASYSRNAQQALASSTADTARSAGNMSTPGGMSLPGALQPGRPAAVSSNTAPSTIPTLPPISTSGQPQPFSSPSRTSTASHSHSYSHSSPAPTYLDDPSKYASTPTHKYMTAQTPQTATYSPLGLEDIRPRADSGNDDGLVSANPYQDLFAAPTNCNYLAPFPVYSFDWCKWSVQQHGLGDAAGKIAIGSYLEDGHNYVRKLVSTALILRC